MGPRTTWIIVIAAVLALCVVILVRGVRWTYYFHAKRTRLPGAFNLILVRGPLSVQGLCAQQIKGITGLIPV